MKVACLFKAPLLVSVLVGVVLPYQNTQDNRFLKRKGLLGLRMVEFLPPGQLSSRSCSEVHKAKCAYAKQHCLHHGSGRKARKRGQSSAIPAKRTPPVTWRPHLAPPSDILVLPKSITLGTQPATCRPSKPERSFHTLVYCFSMTCIYFCSNLSSFLSSALFPVPGGADHLRSLFFLTQVVMATHLPLSSALAASQECWWVVCSSSSSWHVYPFSSDISLTHWWLELVLSHLHVSVNFPAFLLLLISSFILLWLRLHLKWFQMS